MIAAILNIPLAHPVPYAKKGIIIVSGDDDQAQPISYFEQLNQLKDIPITYFMKNDTNLDKATFQKLPAGVDFAFHPDSLLEPEKYEINFKAQLKSVEKLIGKPMKTVRNHGYLNNGYLGHLNVWEENDFSLNLNIPGVDGTALNGSFLPLRIKRLDGTWSNHMSLLTTFGDGFIYAMGKSEKAFIKRIKKIVRQIENSIPGVLVFNLHPENNKKTRLVIDYLNEINSDSNWEFMSISEYLLWIEHLQRVTFERDSDGDTKLLNSKFDNRIRFYYSGFDLQKIKAKI
jgi:hypothetical protein